MNPQIWQEGNHDGGQSLRITLPIMTVPQNVLPIEAIKCWTKDAGIDTIETEIMESLDEIPQHFKTVNSFIDDDLNFKKLRPHDDAIEAEAPHCVYFVQNVVHEDDLAMKPMRTMLHEGYSSHQLTKRPDSIMRFILRNCMPVQKKFYHVASWIQTFGI